MVSIISNEKNLLKQVKDKLRFQLRKCTNCQIYTLKDTCKNCKNSTKSVHPAKFSPDDKYLRYRLADNDHGE